MNRRQKSYVISYLQRVNLQSTELNVFRTLLHNLLIDILI